MRRGLFALDRYIPADERPVLRLRPSLLAIFLDPLTDLAVLLGTGVALWGALGIMGEPLWARRALLAALIATLVRLAWSHLEWLATLYVLTDRRVVAVWGVLRQRAVDVPLDRITHCSVYRSIRERLFFLGSVGFDTAGGPFTEVSWRMLDDPHAILDRVRYASESRSPSPRRVPVIGLAGGIGAGKSHVARVFARLGCVVVDSDAEARAALETTPVKALLVEWWGPGVLTTDGSVDRSRVGAIVFAEPAERARLEGLIHPLVRTTRAEVVDRARREGAPGVVIDAPLLFEAGVDKECDAVVFIDAPREVRLERVLRGRGWNEDELRRREAAQWSLDRKRAASRYVLTNPAERSDAGIEAEASRILQELRVETEGRRG